MDSSEPSPRHIADGSVAAGAGAFLNDIARRYRGALNRFFQRRTNSLSHESEDLTQEVFARLARRNASEDIAQVERYLFRTAQNVLIDHHRRGVSRQHSAHVSYDEAAHAVEDFSTEHVLMAREQVEAVRHCLESLPDLVRMAFVLHRFEDMTYAEIAQRLGVSVSSVEKYMMRALREITEWTKDLM
jgi:RNA polymerase sigma factor (sigma-70 family)